MRLPAIGRRIRIDWVDITAYVNEPLSAAKLSNCWNEGILVKKTKEYIVLASGQYEGGEGDPEGDYCCIPLGVIMRVRHLK